MHILIVSADRSMFCQFGSGCTVTVFNPDYSRNYWIYMIAPGDQENEIGEVGTVIGRYKTATKAMNVIREIMQAILNGEKVYELPEEDE